MLWIGKRKSVGRVAALVLLLAAMSGPWFIDSHPSTATACAPPLVWQGNGYCACLISFMELFRLAFLPEHHLLWLLCLPPTLPFLSTLLLSLSGERRWLRSCHLAAWGLAAIYALFLFVGYWYRTPVLILWGAGLGGMISLAGLAGEILAGRSATLNPERQPINRASQP